MRRTQPLHFLLTLLAGASLGLLAYAGTVNLGRITASAAPPQEAKIAVQAYQMPTEPINDQEAAADTAQTTTLIIDDGSFEQLVGLTQPGTIHFVNRLQPPSYPATLSQLQIFFASGNSHLSQGSAITLLVGSNPGGGENINGTSFQQVGASIQGLDQFNTYNVPNLTINSGDFVVGFRIQIPANVFPGALDTNSGSHRRSYFSTDGVNFILTENPGDMVPDGNFGIRAVVNLQPAILSVSPTSLTFNTVVGQTTPPGQTFTVSNVGSGTLTYTIGNSDPSLVSISPGSGTLSAGQSNVISVFVTPPTQAGTRQAFLTVSAPGAQNSPQTVTVTVTTTNPPAILNVTPTALTFNAVVGQGNPPSQPITVQNTGSGFLSFTITSNSGFVSASPTSGTLSGGQSQTIQVFATNPNSPGTINAQLTVNASGAQNSPRFVSVTINTQPGMLHEQEPNNSPQQANVVPIPLPGQSITIMGDARPGDAGTTISQLASECNHGDPVQDWFRLNINQRDSFQVSLSFERTNADFDLFWFIQTNDFAHFPEGVQLFASSARGPGQPEAFSPRVLEPGTYFLSVSRVRRNNLSDFLRVSYTLMVTRGSSPEIHAIEDVACVGFANTDPSRNGFFVVNRVRPTRYPARLEAISILFSELQGQPSPNGRPVRVIAFLDSSGSGVPPFNPPLVINQVVTVNLPSGGGGAFSTLTLGASGPVINQGDFYVGYVVDRSNGMFLNLGRVLYPNIRSFFSNNGGQTYQQLSFQDASGRQFNVGIRATVNTRPFGQMSAEAVSSPHGDEEMEMIRPRMILIAEP